MAHEWGLAHHIGEPLVQESSQTEEDEAKAAQGSERSKVKAREVQVTIG